MATRVAHLHGVLELDDRDWKRGMTGARRDAKTFKGTTTPAMQGAARGASGSLRGMGVAAGVAGAAILAGMGVAVNKAQNFRVAMTNVNSIMQLGQGEAEALRAQILDIGGDSAAGPQAAAEAFYDIVSGVSDASTHLSILQASLDTAEGGAADLKATTGALVGVMNAYSFAADKTRFVSDVLTRTVQQGVLTMDQLASAMPQVTGLAAQFNVGLDTVGASMAWITKSGYSAGQSATFLKSMFTTLLQPTAALQEAITRMGFASGEALLQAEGLPGAYQALAAQEGSLAGIITNQEALQGALTLTKEGVREFFREYREGLEGSTDRAQKIQEEANSFDNMWAAIEEVAIKVGDFLLPPLTTLIDDVITPGITTVGDFVTNNEDLATALLGVVSAVGFASVAINLLATPIRLIIGLATAMWGAISGPVGLLAGGAVAAAGVGSALGARMVSELANLQYGQGLAPGEQSYVTALIQAHGPTLGTDRQAFEDALFRLVVTDTEAQGLGFLSDAAARGMFSGEQGAGRLDLLHQGYVRGSGSEMYNMAFRQPSTPGTPAPMPDWFRKGTGPDQMRYVTPANSLFQNPRAGTNALAVTVNGNLVVNSDDPETFARRLRAALGTG